MLPTTDYTALLHLTPVHQLGEGSLELVQRLDVMKLDLRIGHSVLRQSTALIPRWRSDSLLTESIQRLSWVHCRRGSSVPGPLEARRRATRRRNASLASVGPSGLPVDVGLLFGPSRDIQWWKVPNSTELQAAAVKR